MKKITILLSFLLISIVSFSQVFVGSDGKIHSGITGGAIANLNEVSFVADTTTFKQGISKINGILYFYDSYWKILITPAGVTSFNTRTGTVTLTNIDITSSLGYVPLDSLGSTFLKTVTLTNAGVIHNAPTYVYNPTTKNYNITQTLVTQLPYKVLASGNASSTPTFTSIDSNYFGGLFKTQVNTAATAKTDTSKTQLDSINITNSRQKNLKFWQQCLAQIRAFKTNGTKSTTASVGGIGDSVGFDIWYIFFSSIFQALGYGGNDGEGSQVGLSPIYYGTANKTGSLTLISSLTNNGSGTATVTSNNHGLTNGQTISITGASNSAYNITAVISGVTTNTFNYTISGTPTSPDPSGQIYWLLQQDYTKWVTGAYSNISSTGGYGIIRNSNGTKLTDTSYFAKIYYLKEAGGGAFKCQTSPDNTTFTDVTGYTSISAVSASGIDSLGILTVPIVNLLNPYFRVYGVSGNVKIINLGFQNTSGGKLSSMLQAGGIALKDMATTPENIIGAYLTDLQPSVLTVSVKDDTTDVTVAAYQTWQQRIYKYAPQCATIYISAYQSQSDSGVQNLQNIKMKRWIDTTKVGGEKYFFDAWNYIGNWTDAASKGLYDNGSYLSISAISYSSSTLSLTTSTAHGLATNNFFRINGSTVNGYDNVYVVTSTPTATTLTATRVNTGVTPSNATGSGGTLMKVDAVHASGSGRLLLATAFNKEFNFLSGNQTDYPYSDLTQSFIPYTGATANVNLGTRTLASGAITSSGTITAPNFSTVADHSRYTNSTTGQLWDLGISSINFWAGLASADNNFSPGNVIALSSRNPMGIRYQTDGNAKVVIATTNTATAAVIDLVTILKNGNVGIGTTTPNTSALLHLNSTIAGFRPPSMTRTQFNAISAKLAGVMAYDSLLNKEIYWDGTTTRVKLDSATADARFVINPLTTTGDIPYSSSGSMATRLPIGSTNQVLTVSGGIPAWTTPITSSTQTANTVFAAPNGSSGMPTFRSIDSNYFGGNFQAQVNTAAKTDTSKSRSDSFTVAQSAKQKLKSVQNKIIQVQSARKSGTTATTLNIGSVGDSVKDDWIYSWFGGFWNALGYGGLDGEFSQWGLSPLFYGTASQVGKLILISSLTRSGTTATATKTAHGLTNGTMVTITGAIAAAYNITTTISNVTANTFDYTVAGSPATPDASGQIYYSTSANYNKWVTGSYINISSAGGYGILRNTQGGNSILDTAFFAKIYYLKESGAGTFKAQTSTDNTTFTDVSGFTSISAANATASDSLGIVTVPITAMLNPYFRVFGVSGSVKIIGLGFSNSSGGKLTNLLGTGGIQLRDMVTTPEQITGAYLQDFAPDLLTLTVKDDATDSTVFAYQTWQNLMYKYAPQCAMVYSSAYESQEQNGLPSLQNIKMKRWFDTTSISGEKYWFDADKYIGNWQDAAFKGMYDAGNTNPVSIITYSAGTVNVTTSAAHGLTTGNYVRVNRVIPSSYVGVYPITVTGANTFTYSLPTAPLTNNGSGGVACLVNSVHLSNGGRQLLGTAFIRDFDVLTGMNTEYPYDITDRSLRSSNAFLKTGGTISGNTTIAAKLSITDTGSVVPSFNTSGSASATKGFDTPNDFRGSNASLSGNVGLTLTSANGSLTFTNPSGATDSKKWRFKVSGTTIGLYLVNDADNSLTSVWTADRTGMTNNGTTITTLGAFNNITANNVATISVNTPQIYNLVSVNAHAVTGTGEVLIVGTPGVASDNYIRLNGQSGDLLIYNQGNSNGANYGVYSTANNNSLFKYNKITGAPYYYNFSLVNKRGIIISDSLGNVSKLTGNAGDYLNLGVNGLPQFTTPNFITNPLTTTGDIIYSSSGSTAARLAIGATNQVLTVNGGIPAWVTRNTVIAGTTTNDAAVAGNIGENVESEINTATNYTTTATYQPVTSITLTAGDWDLSAIGTFNTNTATITAAANAIFVVSTTTASATGATAKNTMFIPQAALLGTSVQSSSSANYRVSIATTTTFFLNTQATFTFGNPQFTGFIRARRAR